MIDWNRVLQLREEVGDSEFRPLVTEFIAEIEERLQRLGSQPDQLLLDLHHMRGAALSVGFVKFGALCLADEMQLRHGRPEGVNRQDLSERFQLTKQQFLNDLPCILGEHGPDLCHVVP